MTEVIVLWGLLLKGGSIMKRALWDNLQEDKRMEVLVFSYIASTLRT